MPVEPNPYKVEPIQHKVKSLKELERMMPQLLPRMGKNDFDVRDYPNRNGEPPVLVFKSQEKPAIDYIISHELMAEFFRQKADAEAILLESREVPANYRSYLEDVPEVYRNYVETGLTADANPPFENLKIIRDADNIRHPEKRQSQQEKIALPYADQTVRATKEDILRLKTTILDKFLGNNLQFHRASTKPDGKGEKQRVIIIPPEDNNGKPLYLTDQDIRYWHQSLSSDQSAPLMQDPVYHRYFSNQLFRNDKNMVQLVVARNQRISGQGVDFRPINANQPGYNPNLDYRPVEIPLDKLRADPNWAVPDELHADDTISGERYRVVTQENPAAQIHVSRTCVRAVPATQQNVNMAATAAMLTKPENRSQLVAVSSKSDNLSVLKMSFEAVIAKGGIPIVESRAMAQGVAPITQQMVFDSLSATAKTQYNNLLADASPASVLDCYKHKTGMPIPGEEAPERGLGPRM